MTVIDTLPCPTTKQQATPAVVLLHELRTLPLPYYRKSAKDFVEAAIARCTPCDPTHRPRYASPGPGTLLCDACVDAARPRHRDKVPDPPGCEWCGVTTAPDGGTLGLVLLLACVTHRGWTRYICGGFACEACIAASGHYVEDI